MGGTLSMAREQEKRQIKKKEEADKMKLSQPGGYHVNKANTSPPLLILDTRSFSHTSHSISECAGRVRSPDSEAVRQPTGPRAPSVGPIEGGRSGMVAMEGGEGRGGLLTSKSPPPFTRWGRPVATPP
uniref:Uncharacterized protein n=1 Tax=Hemiselmis andersenii TaxID=464988 RepID=A0A6U4MAR9_HEMAN|mmetsp:Transcript_29161/g.68238  ORF Transcript_29161/g.68238 Transcript_29161/m.68238 type:complete len:128 (-) Transcript_29161:287-670(-)